MPDATHLLGGLLVAAAIIYAVTGGADFGGGVWDLLASGPRKQEQRRLIERAITPVWEVNHVWMILIVVILFSGFPGAFGALCTALHIPLTLMLLGIVARGTAFTFRTYDRREDDVQQRWGLLFSVASVITPLLLGNIIGSVSTGGITVEEGVVTSGFIHPWLSSGFAWSVGVLTLLLFAYLAAVYLANEADDEALANDFRLRALVCGGATTAGALITYWLTEQGAPELYSRLADHSLLLFGAAALSALMAIFSLIQRRYAWARLLAIGQVVLVIGGWGCAQYPSILMGSVDIEDASGPAHVQQTIAWILFVGIPPLVGCIYYMMRIFKGSPASK